MNYKNGCRIACIIGTRPEVIKMLPVIKELQARGYQNDIINTGQHLELSRDILALFSVSPTYDLKIMRHNQSLCSLSSELFTALDNLILPERYKLVLLQGDTTTALIASQAAFYKKIPIAHVEAGLRSHDIYHPFPEEMNRIFISKLATLHFSPTKEEQENLINEGVPADRIMITGNPGIDTLLYTSKQSINLPANIDVEKKIILVTMHRRESFGVAMCDTFKTLVEISKKFAEVQIIFPVHPNPNVRKMAEEVLSIQENIKLIDPLPYDKFIALLKHAYLVMTDSGGLQEEAPALNKPVLILRDTTERPLVLELGLGILVGFDQDKIISSVTKLLTDPVYYKSMQKNISPYGDGRAAQRIVDCLENYFCCR